MHTNDECLDILYIFYSIIYVKNEINKPLLLVYSRRCVSVGKNVEEEVKTCNTIRFGDATKRHVFGSIILNSLVATPLVFRKNNGNKKQQQIDI